LCGTNESRAAITQMFAGADLPAASGLFAVVGLEPGASIGVHQLVGEDEVYYVLRGEGRGSRIPSGLESLTNVHPAAIGELHLDVLDRRRLEGGELPAPCFASSRRWFRRSALPSVLAASSCSRTSPFVNSWPPWFRGGRPRIRPVDRVFWVAFRRLWSRWADTLVIVKPDTVVAWHRAGFRLYWRWPGKGSVPIVHQSLAKCATSFARWQPRISGALPGFTRRGTAWLPVQCRFAWLCSAPRCGAEPTP